MVGMIQGGLVSWQDMGEERFGVITELTGHQVTVQFDDFDDVRIFRRAPQVVRRVEVSGSVRRVSTGEIGVVQGLSNAEPPRWNVAIGSQVKVIQERDLRPHILLDPANRLRNGMVGTPCQFWLAMTAHAYRLDALDRDLIALGQSSVDLKPHQVSVVHRVITGYPHRFLLCDEVGLGQDHRGRCDPQRTARSESRRPRAHRRPAQPDAPVAVRAEDQVQRDVLDHQQRDREVSAQPARSRQPTRSSTSTVPSCRARGSPTGSGAASRASLDWDMVIVDEAHHARVRYRGDKVERTQSLPGGRAARLARGVLQTLGPLPHRNADADSTSSEIYGLIELLDPALFPTLAHFTNNATRSRASTLWCRT